MMTKQIRIAVYWFAINSLLSTFHGVSAQERRLIDVASDIPDDGSWTIDCPNGYATLPTDYNCEGFGGNVTIPPTALNGETGFWTKCGNTCQLRYTVQSDDATFKVRTYQSGGSLTELSYDGGKTWHFNARRGWIEMGKSLGSNDVEIILRFEHLSQDFFSALDKMVFNGDFDPPENVTSS